MKRFLTILKRIWEIGNSSIIVFLVCYLKIDLAGYLKGLLSKDIWERLNQKDIKFAFNTIFILLIFEIIANLISTLLSYINKPLVIRAIISNMDGTTSTNIPISSNVMSLQNRRLNIDLSIKYKYKFTKYLIDKLGGYKLIVNKPLFAILQVDDISKRCYSNSAVDDNFDPDSIIIKPTELIGRNELSREIIRIICNVATALPIGQEGDITVELQTNNSKRFKKLLLDRLIHFEKLEHNIQSNTII
jgi:hypothetical protein